MLIFFHNLGWGAFCKTTKCYLKRSGDLCFTLDSSRCTSQMGVLGELTRLAAMFGDKMNISLRGGKTTESFFARNNKIM